MKLLFVTDISPFPVRHATGVVSYHWMRYLAARHAVGLVSLEPGEQSAAEHLREMGIRVFPSPTIPPGAAGVGAALLGRMPSAISRLQGHPIRTYLLEATEEWRPDAMVLVGPAMGALLDEGMWPWPVVFVPYDAVTLNLASRFRFVRNPARLAYTWLEYWKWMSAERTLYPRADVCVAVSQLEADAITRGWPEAAKPRMRVIPLGVDVSYHQPEEAEERVHRLVSTGNMGAVQTVVSLRWFLRRVWPEVRRQIPDVTLDLVGRDPHPALARLASSIEGTRVTGTVPDVRPYLAQASLCIYPILLGSGVKTRLLEAMAMGRAVVATSRCLQGLGALAGGELAIADDAGAFAGAVVRLLRDPAQRRDMGSAARRFTETHHSWGGIVGGEVEEMLRGLAGA